MLCCRFLRSSTSHKKCSTVLLSRCLGTAFIRFLGTGSKNRYSPPIHGIVTWNRFVNSLPETGFWNAIIQNCFLESLLLTGSCNGYPKMLSGVVIRSRLLQSLLLTGSCNTIFIHATYFFNKCCKC